MKTKKAVPETEEMQALADPVERRDDDGPSGEPLVPHEDAPTQSFPTDSEESGSEAPTKVLERVGPLSDYRARIASHRDRRWRGMPLAFPSMGALRSRLAGASGTTLAIVGLVATVVAMYGIALVVGSGSGGPSEDQAISAEQPGNDSGNAPDKGQPPTDEATPPDTPGEGPPPERPSRDQSEKPDRGPGSGVEPAPPPPAEPPPAEPPPAEPPPPPPPPPGP